MELFTPLRDIKEYCWIFRFFSIMQFIVAIIGLLVFIWGIYNFKLTPRPAMETSIAFVVNGLVGCISAMIGYFVQRVFYTMCVKMG